MNTAKLVLFINKRTGEEYVVIVTEGELSEHAKAGFTAAAEVELPEDEIYRFPTDRVLVAED